MLIFVKRLYMAKNQTLAELIKEIKYRSALNQSEIATQIGVSKQYLSDTINGRYPFTDELKQKLYEQFTYLGDKTASESKPEKSPASDPTGKDYRLVPLINIDSVGGLHSWPDVIDEDQYTEKYIPFSGARDDDYCIRESGSSMVPSIPPGSILLIRNVPNWAEYFGYGAVYVLELTDGRRITKEIRKSEVDAHLNVLCHSFNDTVADEELPKSLIRSVWKVVKVLTNFGF